MTGFDASTEGLRAASAQLGQLHEEVLGSFTSVRSEVGALLTGGWRGGAARGFASGWEEWQHGFDEAMAALAAMGQLLHVTGSGYEAAETTSVSAINSSSPL